MQHGRSSARKSDVKLPRSNSLIVSNRVVIFFWFFSHQKKLNQLGVGSWAQAGKSKPPKASHKAFAIRHGLQGKQGSEG